MLAGCCLENSVIHPKHSAFFRLGKNKMHRKTSLRQSLHKSQHLELCDMVERDETTTLSLTPERSETRNAASRLMLLANICLQGDDQFLFSKLLKGYVPRACLG